MTFYYRKLINDVSWYDAARDTKVSVHDVFCFSFVSQQFAKKYQFYS